jgi:hypothetical protein
MLQVCLFEYCICFTHMLQVFYLDVAYVLRVVVTLLSISLYSLVLYINPYGINGK